jgi:hypothetical protein
VVLRLELFQLNPIPCSLAIDMASFVFMIPIFSPSLPITWTSGEEILLLDLGPLSLVSSLKIILFKICHLV